MTAPTNRDAPNPWVDPLYPPKPTTRGAQALAKRLKLRFGNVYPDGATFESDAAAILGPHGVYIEDAREHEPQDAMRSLPTIRCSCGHLVGVGESFYDHIGVQRG